MITDTEIKLQGRNALITAQREVQAEKFISLKMRDPFDYTEWQRKLWIDKSVEEICSVAMEHKKEKNWLINFYSDALRSRDPTWQFKR